MLVFQTTYASELKVKWSEVVSLMTSGAVNVMLTDDTTVRGLVLAAGDGKARIKAGEVLESAQHTDAFETLAIQFRLSVVASHHLLYRSGMP